MLFSTLYADGRKGCITMGRSKEVTSLLIDWGQGDQQALDELMPLVYDELRELANHHLRRERPGHTLQPTALVNEAYLRLVQTRERNWQSRAHFFGIASQVMRRILVDHARKVHAQIRGGSQTRLPLDEAIGFAGNQDVDLLRLDEALASLAEFDPQQSRIVELRFFGGLTHEEVAEILNISPARVRREWTTAKAWLYHQLSDQ